LAPAPPSPDPGRAALDPRDVGTPDASVDQPPTVDNELPASASALRLDGRVVWLTGASRGMGRALAFAFAEAGAELLLSARSADGLAELARTIRELGGTAEISAGSVADPDLIARAAALIRERWGRLDALVNDAGMSPVLARAERLEWSDWGEVLEVNLTAPLACCRAALPLLEQAPDGSVVNISSIHGTRAHERLLAYAASRGGLEMVTRTLAVEWASRGVRVNAVAPRYVETDMTSGVREHAHWSESLRARIPMGRFAALAEVTHAVLFLAGPRASYVTGTTLYVDGGWAAA
jgi:NAD(P)-dependent dehydrogenase (short-subunit alcohol dehydrogenase family)